MPKVWFTSDTHYGHKNIVAGVSDWSDKSGCRNFNTVEEMNAEIIEGINANVAAKDTLYHLGDWSFGGVDNIWNFRKQLRVRDIRLVLGNHDEHIVTNILLRNVIKWDEGKGHIIDLPKEIHKVFSRGQWLIDGKETRTVAKHIGNDMPFVFAKQLFSSVDRAEEITVEGQKIILSHYAHRVWNGSHKGYWMLYGHSHGMLPEMGKFKTMDVGLDTHPEFRPYSFTELKEIMKDRIALVDVDHHGANTNAR